MYKNSTDPVGFTATTENILDEDLHNRREPNLFSIISEEVYAHPDITAAELRVYLIIAGYCGSSGVCYIKQKALEERIPWLTIDIFKKNAQSLEKKGFLYRRKILSKHRGSSRQLIVRCHWEKYFAQKWKERDLEECAKVEAYFTGSDEDYLKNRYYQDIQHRMEMRTKKESQLKEKLESTESIQKNTIMGYSPPHHNGAVSAPSRNNTNVLYERKNNVDDLDAVVLSKLEEANITKEQVEMAMKYCQMKPEKMRQAKNPVGLLLSGLRDGWIENELKEKAAKQAEKEMDETTAALNKKLAEETYKELKELEGGFTIFLNNNSILFDFKIGLRRGSIPLGWKEKNFKLKLSKLVELAHDCIRDYREANSVEKSGT